MKNRMLALAMGALLSWSGAQWPARAAQVQAQTGGEWVTAWATALQPIPQRESLPLLYRAPDVAGRTIRQIVYPTLAGDAVRIHLSNEYGRMPLVIRALGIARSGGRADVGAGARVTFGGRAGVTLPPGREIDSDPVKIDVAAGAPYAVSAWLGEGQTLDGWHRVASQVNYISVPGDHVGDTTGGAYEHRFTQYAWVTGLAVHAPGAQAVAAIGDSITDGMRSTLNANRRWPDALARRIAGAGGAQTAVINLGISGNRLLSDSACYGDALERRFAHDALDRPGVRTAVLLIGINDINFQAMPPRPGLDCDFPHTAVTAASLINGYRRVIAAAHARGVRVLGATITPATLPSQREAIRAEVNHWVRTGGAFDGVIDFDAALRDPARPTELRASFDSGDHVHPNDAGYAAMAEAVGLSALGVR